MYIDIFVHRRLFNRPQTTDHRPQNLTLHDYNVFLWTVDYCTVDS